MPGDESPKVAPVTDLHVFASLRKAERLAELERTTPEQEPRTIRILLGDEHPWTLRYETDGERHEITDGVARLLAWRLLELIRTRTQLRRECGCAECLASGLPL